VFGYQDVSLNQKCTAEAVDFWYPELGNVFYCIICVKFIMVLAMILGTKKLWEASANSPKYTVVRDSS